ncbi:MAG TPA: CoB--CoM heterodisulfide reductase iron-sulfur subunit B family protein [Bacteroidales bacterium]|jgi:heterodisulfide reductase subunit B|nr:CoB--CoM heterodisulfide reductase iron-sulfur subunit B family protein [Bacteroidales bacterium]
MALGFYPGCSLKGSSREYNESVLALAKTFGIELTEISDWNCCGATAAHNMNKELSLALPARVLALAEKQGLTEILIPCAACYSRLATTQHELQKQDELRSRISGVIEMDLKATISLINVIQFIEKYVLNSLEGRILKPFNHKVACYYGCLLVRPHGVLQFDREEDPQTMDKVMAKIGASPLDWAFKTECCGAGLSVSRTDTVSRLSGKIIMDASDRGAEVIIVACPMCHSNLDMRRNSINKYMGIHSSIPVLYITQALGMALGINDEELGIHRHFVKVENLRIWQE